MATKWKVYRLEKTVDSNEAIILARYFVDVVDDKDPENFARHLDHVTFDPSPSSPDFVPFSDVTHDMALGWVKNKLGDNAQEIEKRLEIEVFEATQPKTIATTPWSLKDV